jgi:hypothetical protein
VSKITKKDFLPLPEISVLLRLFCKTIKIGMLCIGKIALNYSWVMARCRIAYFDYSSAFTLEKST